MYLVETRPSASARLPVFIFVPSHGLFSLYCANPCSDKVTSHEADLDCCFNFTQRTHVPRDPFRLVLGLSRARLCVGSMGGLVSTASASDAGVCPRALSLLSFMFPPSRASAHDLSDACLCRDGLGSCSDHAGIKSEHLHQPEDRAGRANPSVAESGIRCQESEGWPSWVPSAGRDSFLSGVAGTAYDLASRSGRARGQRACTGGRR